MTLSVILRSALSRALTWAEHDQNLSTLASGVDAAIGLSQTSQVASTAAQAAAGAAQTSAAGAQTSANLALAAWSASTAPAEQLAAISTNLHSGAILQTLIYDTSKDSDGGAWRKRCTDKSWYTEALGFTGKWLGQPGNLATAWASGDSYGPEMLTNPGFDSDLAGWGATNWTWYAGSGDGYSYCAGASPITQTPAGIIIGRTYKVTIDLVSSSGEDVACWVSLGDGLTTQTITATGIHELYFTPASAAGGLMIYPMAGSNIALRSVSVKMLGAVAGDGYQNTADGKFYVLTGTSTHAEIFRGNVREFPAQVAIVLETARVIIYDLTQPTCPVWMVFLITSGNRNALYALTSLTSVCVLNGMMVVGGQGRLALVNFIKDNSVFHFTSLAGCFFTTGLSRRNDAYALDGALLGYGAIINVSPVNDVAITTLPTAPTDQATGLPVPTIAVATAGGVSVIKDDLSVMSGADTTYSYSITFDALKRVLWSRFASVLCSPPAGSLTASFVGSSASTPYITSAYSATSIPNAVTLTAGSLSKLSRDGRAIGTILGVNVYPRASNSPNNLIAGITKDYSTGYLVGDIRGAYLADTAAETLIGPELVTNGTFDVDTTGWPTAPSYSSSAVATGGEMQVTAIAPFGRRIYSFATTIGKSYRIQGIMRMVSGGGNAILNVTTSVGADIVVNQTTSTTNIQTAYEYVAIATTTYICAGLTTAGNVAAFDNISVKQVEPDRSVKGVLPGPGNGLYTFGTLTKAAVVAGANLVAYSGFSTLNYLEQPYSANLDFGTGDFTVYGWADVLTPATNQAMMDRVDVGGVGARLGVSIISSSWGFSCSLANGYTATAIAVIAGLHFVCLRRVAGVISFFVDGVQIYTVANTVNVTNATAIMRMGLASGSAIAPCLGKLALWRVTATPMSDDQITHTYRTELPLFQAGAQCTIAGTSTAVTALAYDDLKDELHVGTSWGRSAFSGLVRVRSEATTVGAITSLAAYEGIVITGGASSGRSYLPAMYLRDELRRKDVARKALGMIPAFFDYTATASQTAFVAPKGFTIKALYKNGTLMRETTTGVYWTRSSDGFAETATLSVGASVSDWISIMCVRA